MSLSKGGSKGSQTSVTSLNPATQGMVQGVYNAAQGAAGAGPGTNLTGASNYYNGAMGYGNLGMGALSGSPAAVQQLMNPYLSTVMSGMQNQFGLQNQQGLTSLDSSATAQGAFGGSRNAIADSNYLSQNNINQGAALSQLLSGGYNQAMQQAGTLANFGMGAAGQYANLGTLGVGNPSLWAMNILKQGVQGLPYGTSTGSSYSGVNGNASFKIPGLSG